LLILLLVKLTSSHATLHAASEYHPKDRLSIESKSTLYWVWALSKNGKIIRIQIWDTSGQEIYKALARTYFKGAHRALVVYDISKHKTFEYVKNWLNDVRNTADLDPVIMLIGSKCDLLHLRKVKEEEVIQYAKENGMPFIETSALDMSNVDAAFEGIVDGINTFNYRNIQPNY